MQLSVRRSAILTVFLAMASPLRAHAAPSKALSADDLAEIQRRNAAAVPVHHSQATHVTRAFAEYEHAKYLLMSGVTELDTLSAKTAILKNLPADMTAVLYAVDSADMTRQKQQFDGVIPADRLKFILIPIPNANASDPFWSRDSTPYPVYVSHAGAADTMSLVQAKYYSSKHFEPGTWISRFFQTPLLTHNYIYTGGDFVTDTHGQCATIERFGVPDQIYKDYYGCQTITRFEQLGGIGDIDERIKFISDSVAVTDEEAYRGRLEALGFHVVSIPNAGKLHPEVPYETYANTLLTNETIFVPQFGLPEDSQAVAIYQGLGLHVVPVFNKTASDDGEGNIHCMTMTYPDGAFVQDPAHASLVHFR